MEFKTGDFNHVLSLCHEASAIPDSIGQTALFYAVQRASDSEAKQVAERLITVSGIDPTRRDFGGQSPIFYAAAVGNLETVKLLISHGCSPDEKDNLNQSPLFYSSRDGRAEVVGYLLSQGALASDIDRNGQTPLFYAARENKRDVCELLLSAKASIDHRDLTGRRPSYFARLGNHSELASFLENLQDAESPEDEHDNNSQTRRKRYRLVYVSTDGSFQAPTIEQLECIESEFPEICVWSKSGPIATGLAITTSPPQPVRVVHGVVGRKKVAPPPPAAPKPIWMTAARQIVSDIFKKEDAWIFLRPVDPVRDQCLDYTKVITLPMDFGTIRKKMSKYSKKIDFLDDCELVFSNCRIYNKPGTLPDVLCQRVNAYFRQLLEQYKFTSIPDSTSEQTPPSIS